jgi:hypothetical protein
MYRSRIVQSWFLAIISFAKTFLLRELPYIMFLLMLLLDGIFYLAHLTLQILMEHLFVLFMVWL